MTDAPVEREAESSWARLRHHKVVEWGLACAAVPPFVSTTLQEKLRVLRSSSTLIVLFMGGGSIYILPYLSSYLYIPMKDAMHLDNMQIGLMGSAMGIASMIFYWPGGWVADRFSPRKLITLSLIANGLLGLWLATIPPFKVLAGRTNAAPREPETLSATDSSAKSAERNVYIARRRGSTVEN